MTATIKTFCRNCGAQCSMEIDVKDGRMVRARPDGSASPYGGYMCPKEGPQSSFTMGWNHGF